MGLYITINGMNDKLKNSRESFTESPNDIWEIALDTARKNLWFSPEIWNHLEETLKKLNNLITWVKSPEELILIQTKKEFIERELYTKIRVTNGVFALIPSESAINSMNGLLVNDSNHRLLVNDSSYKLAA